MEVLTIIICLFSLFLVYCGWILIRNEATCAFRLRVNNLNYNYQISLIDKGIYNEPSFYEMMPSYGSMLYSFTPLKLESFFSDEDIKKLLSV